MKKIAAVVVTYNRKVLLKENIESLLSQTIADLLDIIVIDNASTDNTYEYISEYVNNGSIIYKNTGANLGGAGGFHYGIKYAAECGYDYVWIMDNDCIPTQNSLEELLKADKQLKGEYGFLSSKVLWKDGEICKMNIQKKNLLQKVKNFSNELIPVSMASFVSLFIPVSVIKEIGLPIKEFFIWTDDFEYTRRISKKYRCYLDTKSIVIHKSDSNIGSNIAVDTIKKLDRYKYLYRNEVYLYKREGIKGFLYEVFRLTLHVMRVIFKSKDNKLKRINCIIKGTIEGLSFNPGIQYIGD
ncbi:MAG: glycosyltransferase family 2 protein [Ruminococcus sp.]|nr:glycosyltransferase family 2 protein [Ruminococcus sp.]